jgi:ArsR family transcriptional regulator
MTAPADHQVFKALSEPIRLRIFNLLTQGELCICDLMEVLSLPQSTVSRHMSRLKSAGMTIDRREGKWIYYSLAKSPNPLMTLLAAYVSNVKEQRPFNSDLNRLELHRKKKIRE